MKRNFQFDGVTVIRFGDRVIDLHNAYDIEQIGTDLSGNTVTISFSRNRYAINLDLPTYITLRCTGNARVAFNNLNLIAAPLNHEGIEIGYFDEHCDWDAFTDESMAASQKPKGLHIYFINGLVVRIYCEMTTLEMH